MIQPIPQAHISKQINAFRAKQYKVQQQYINIYISDELQIDINAVNEKRTKEQ